jgi:hypothetical protein
MTWAIVPAFCLPVAWRCAPRWALRLTLDAPLECFESASTTDVRSRAPVAKTRSPETARRALWGNPPAFCFEILPDGASPPSSEGTPDHLAVIQPPAAPCLTARHRLWHKRPAGRALAQRSSALAAFSAARRAAARTSDASAATGAGNARALRSPSADPASPIRTSMQTASTRSRRLPPRKPGASTLAGARPEPRARWPAGAVAARAHRRSRTSTRPSIASFRVLLRAACASTASADRCFNEHCPGPPEHPGRVAAAGTTASPIDRRLSIIRQPLKVRGVRDRGSPNPRRSLPGLLPRETSPRPRSLQTPRVAVIACHPAWRRRG